MIRKTELSRIGLFISFIMLVVILLPVTTYADSMLTTTAITENDWATKGWSHIHDGEAFQADKNLTRAELVALINALFDFKDLGDVSFSDVTSESVYYKEISKAFHAGYVQGRGDNTFNPEGEVVNVEAYIMISKALNLDITKKPEQMKQFKDANEVPQWALGEIEAFVQEGFLSDKNKIKPFEKITGSDALNLLSKISMKDDVATEENVNNEEEIKGNGNSPLNFLGAYFVTIDGNQSVELNKLEDGASDVDDVVIKLVFDRGVVRDYWDNNQMQVKLQGNNGNIISSEVFRIEDVDAEKSNIFIRPLEEIKSGKTVNIIIGKDLKANNGNTIGKEEVISYTAK